MTIDEQLEAVKAHTKIGDHEVVVCSDTTRDPLHVCRKCKKRWKSAGTSVTQQALLEPCAAAAPSLDLSEQYALRPRNDRVILRVVVRKEINGILVPEDSPEGQEFYVEAFGPKVAGLKVGDRVMAKGQRRVDWDFLPGFPFLMHIGEQNVLVVFERKDQSATPCGGECAAAECCEEG